MAYSTSPTTHAVTHTHTHTHTQMNEMIDQSMNHAGIMTWGWFNEGPSDDKAACSG
jgi:hypothetical protein